MLMLELLRKGGDYLTQCLESIKFDYYLNYASHKGI